MLIKLFGNQPQHQAPVSFIGFSQRLDNDYITQVLIMSCLFLFALTLLMLPAYYFDARVLNFSPIWAKPIKFSLSLGLHFLTLALLAQQLDRQRRTGVILMTFTYVAVASMLFEQLYISVQAARGRASHFNGSTDFEAIMYGLMGFGAVNLILVSFVLGLLIYKYGDKTFPGLRLGSILGLTIGSVLTLIYAMTMGNSPAHSHLVGEAINHTNIPIVGWSREVGDLRIPHFIATHMMQVLPLLGLVLDKLKWSPRTIVSLVTIILVVTSAVFFDWALAGIPVMGV
jgi:hypothetical protein